MPSSAMTCIPKFEDVQLTKGVEVHAFYVILCIYSTHGYWIYYYVFELEKLKMTVDYVILYIML